MFEARWGMLNARWGFVGVLVGSSSGGPCGIGQGIGGGIARDAEEGVIGEVVEGHGGPRGGFGW